MQKDNIESVIKKLRNKIWLNNILRTMINFLLCSSIVLFLFMIMIHLVPVVSIAEKSLIIVGMTFMGLFVGLLQRPTIKKTALIGDQLGLQERLITYLEYKDEKQPIVKKFKQEVNETLENINLLKKYKLNLQWKKILISFLMLILSIGIYFLPSLSMDIARDREDINSELEEEAKIIHKMEEEIEDNNTLNKRKKESMQAYLENLEKKLNKSYNYKEAALHVSDIQKKVKQYAQQATSDDIKSLSGVFNGLDNNHKLLQEAMKSGDINSIQEILGMENFTAKEQQRMLDNIKEIEEDNYGKNEVLNQIKAVLQEDALTGKKLTDALETAVESKEVSKIAEKVEKNLESMKERFMAKAGEGFNSIGGEQKGVDMVEGENDGLGSGEYTEQKANEIVLGNRGNKLTINSNGIGGGENVNLDGGNIKGKEGEVEKNTESTRLGLDSAQSSFVKGDWEEQGRIKDKYSDNVLEIKGDNKSLAIMYKEFQDKGMEYVLKYEIPLEKKEIVLEYFKSLSGGK